MDKAGILTLSRLNADFYRRHAASFSQTRQSAWSGWDRLLAEIGLGTRISAFALSVLDVACGNGRFGRYLAESLQNTELNYFAVDNCDVLFDETFPACSTTYQHLDIIEVLLDGLDVSDETLSSPASFGKGFTAPLCDLAVSFGFLHHVPTMPLRCALVRALAEHTCVGGYFAVSLWRFLNSPDLAKKAELATKQAVCDLELQDVLEDGDYLLGWQEFSNVWRYCHHFSDKEIDQLAKAPGSSADLVGWFSSDGRSGDLNAYLLWRKC